MDTSKQAIPPYGVLNDHFLDVIREHPIFPNDWRGLPGSTASREDQWQKWKEQTLDIIAEVLWPRYIPGKGWEGKSTAFMAELTKADLKLLPDLRKILDKPVAGKTSTTHREFFETEDTQAKPFGAMHNAYDPTLPFVLFEKLPRMLSWALGSKAGTAAPQLKQVLQRPRAYQVAFIWGLTDYTLLRATSADSPSICSGHAYEGTLMVGGLIEQFLQSQRSLSQGNWNAIQQFAVDIGDRRVMAGVHYPSDNLASWLMVMRLASQVFWDPKVKTMLWEAISQQSHVFKAIEAVRITPDGKVYEPALKALEAAAHE